MSDDTGPLPRRLVVPGPAPVVVVPLPKPAWVLAACIGFLVGGSSALALAWHTFAGNGESRPEIPQPTPPPGTSASSSASVAGSDNASASGPTTASGSSSASAAGLQVEVKGMDLRAVRNVIEPQEQDIRNCFGPPGAEDPHRDKGKVRFRFAVRSDGTVGAVELLDDEPVDALISACVESVAKKAHFQRTPGKDAMVTVRLIVPP